MWIHTTAALLLIGLTQLQAEVSAQQVTLHRQGITIEGALTEINRQTGYHFVWMPKHLGSDRTVNIDVSDVSLETAVEQLLRGLPLSYELKGKTIVIREAAKSFRPVLHPERSAAESNGSSLIPAFQEVRGKIVDSLGQPLSGASVRVLNADGKRTSLQTTTDSHGDFVLRNVPDDAMLEISYVGYVKHAIRAAADIGRVMLQELSNELAEVMVSTGYQTLPKERATGSFTQIDEALINRSVSTDIISRLEGVTNALQFDARRVDNRLQNNGDRELRVRGVSTINSDKSPLIVIDNFPYEGDINSINPNDVTQVTVLKDAAAASIWGARAGNGVIVITTRSGKYNQPVKINATLNTTVQEKPDLFYDPSFLPAKEFIEVEKHLFASNIYNTRINNAALPALSPAVELMVRHRSKQISDQELDQQLEQLKRYDLREDASAYLYRVGLNQQYALNITGGTSKTQYTYSGGYDRNLHDVRRNDNSRITLNIRNTYRVTDRLELDGNVNYMNASANNNGLGIATLLQNAWWVYPYARLRGDTGDALALPYNHRLSYASTAIDAGLVDWTYKPLDEVALNDVVNKRQELRINTAVKYQLSKDLNVELRYQYHSTNGVDQTIRDRDSYHVRDLVNRFTQADGARIFPYLDVLNKTINTGQSHHGRAQVNLNKQVGIHEVNALGGMEIRQDMMQTDPFELLGYDKDVLTYINRPDLVNVYNTRPNGSGRIPVTSLFPQELTDRYLSYFGNFSYAYRGRYVLSGSSRWDASNLFGVNANQKGVPLWSAGVLWRMAEEPFYQLSWLPMLNVRVTNGYNGNIYKAASAYAVGTYQVDLITSLQRIAIRRPANPNLRWEQVHVLNLGLDFRTVNNTLSGSIEYYTKNSTDLMGRVVLDPTVGHRGQTESQMTALFNYASMKTKGVDVELTSLNIDRSIKWKTVWLLGVVTNQVTKHETAGSTGGITAYLNNLGTASSPVVGKSLDALFSIPWGGLDPQTGDPLVVLNGQPSTNYSGYFSGLGVDSLAYSGVAFPIVQGSFRNTFEWNNWSLGFNIVYKAGYVFRRSSIEYSNLFNSWQGHSDYLDRWQKPGDELFTSIPSMPQAIVNNRDLVYNRSEATLEKGDHIRLQDIDFGYRVSKPSWGVQSARVFLYARNLGLLWRANKSGLDPDYPSARFLPGRSLALGIQATF